MRSKERLAWRSPRLFLGLPSLSARRCKFSSRSYYVFVFEIIYVSEWVFLFESDWNRCSSRASAAATNNQNAFINITEFFGWSCWLLFCTLYSTNMHRTNVWHTGTTDIDINTAALADGAKSKKTRAADYTYKQTVLSLWNKIENDVQNSPAFQAHRLWTWSHHHHHHQALTNILHWTMRSWKK